MSIRQIEDHVCICVGMAFEVRSCLNLSVMLGVLPYTRWDSCNSCEECVCVLFLSPHVFPSPSHVVCSVGIELTSLIEPGVSMNILLSSCCEPLPSVYHL